MKRSKQSLSNYKLLTMDMGNLIPIGWYEAIPGDSIQHATSALIRCSPLLAPVMHPVQVRIHHFFVPNRLMWDEWEDFITGGPDGTSVPVHPNKYRSAVAEGDLYDYLGIPVDPAYPATTTFNALPVRAYQMIYNDFYRDQDLCSEATVDKTSGSDVTPGVVRKIAWEKDYFTTARPYSQKGDAITIPIGATADVVPEAANSVPTFAGSASGNANLNASGTDAIWTSTMVGNAEWDDPKLTADLSTATGIDVADFRLALSLQRYQEARAKYGSRYVEYLRYLGVRSSDARLQNPEYLGGGRQTIQFSEVLSSDGSNTGDMKGHGISAMRSNKFRRFFEEHGIVMSLMSVVPKAIYSQSINRGFLRETKEDYFQKELQHIGEQEILNKEVYSSHSSPLDVFGYQSRYDEYRSIPSTIAGEFRSTNDHWHYSRIHSGDIALNSSFVEATPTKRVNASDSTDCLYVMANHSIQARRPISSKQFTKVI